MNFVETCRQFIAKDSSPSVGNSELANFAAEYCRKAGLQVEEQVEFQDDIEQKNILIRPLNKSENVEDFLLQTHLDTSDPGPFQAWMKNDSNPFNATIIEEAIYGLGAADAKLDFLCKAEALKSFKETVGWKRNPLLVGTYGEEIGMQGALRLIRKNKIKAKYAFIGEPSNLKLINAAKGYASVEVRIPFSEIEIQFRNEHNLKESVSTQTKMFHGVAAHSSMPHLGESAIGKMFDYLAQVPENVALLEIDGGINHNTVPAHAFLELDMVTLEGETLLSRLLSIYRELKNLEHLFYLYNDPQFLPSHPTLNIGKITTLEDGIVITGCCRIPPLVSQEVWEVWMKQIKDACSLLNCDFRILDYKKSFQSSAESNFAKEALHLLKEILPDSHFETQSSTNEASIFSRTGIECLCFGPGVREGNIHTTNENVKIKDLEIAIEFYKKAIERFCL